MKPKDIEQLISEWVDGTLSADQVEQVTRRLAADPALATEHRLHKALASVLADIAAEPMPPVDWELQRQMIQAAMERDALLSPPARTWPRRLVRWSAAVTAAAAVFAVAVLGRGWLIGPGAPSSISNIVVTLVLPDSPENQALAAGPIRPSLAMAGELVVDYSEPEVAVVGNGRPVSGLGRAGTIIISVAAPARGAAWAWEDL